MPLYEFQCSLCGSVFEVMLRFSEAGTIPQCPNCECKDTHKKLSAVASFGSSQSNSANSSSCASSGGFS